MSESEGTGRTEPGAGLPPGGWEIPVATSTGGYPVRVGAGVLDELPVLLERLAGAHRYALISDARVAELHGEGVLARMAAAGLDGELFSFPPGEASKTRASWSELTDRMIGAGIGRDGCVIALGGGVTGDLAGFVAATYMRGVPLAQIPTSLVAMIDSAVGGKVGVDVPGGKNLVGAFHPPAFVLADPALAATLPPSERRRGLAEAIKHGAILDAAYLDELVGTSGALLEGDPDPTARAVARSVELKAGVVAEDEREAGLRQILNFGHTLGHALEAATGWRLAHGEAVAVGMVLEARLGEALGVTEEGTAVRLTRALEAFELPTSLPGGLDVDEVLAWTGRDKKVRRGAVRYVLLRRIGEVDPGAGWSHEVPRERVRDVLA